MLAFALALGASATWGVSDFLAGLKSRGSSILTVLVVSQTAGLAVLLPLAAAQAGSLPPTEIVVIGMTAGVVNVVALAAFYCGLSIGPMAVVAPITACDAIVPVAAGAALGSAPGLLDGAGMALAIGGIALASRPEGAHARGAGPATPAAVGLALLALLFFGLFTLAIDSAADGGVLWALLFSRLGSVVALWLYVLVWDGRRLAYHESDGAAILAIGLTDIAATALFAVAATQGLITHVGVLGSLYPVVTVILARRFLHERIGRLQFAGSAVAIVGAALLAGSV